MRQCLASPGASLLNQRKVTHPPETLTYLVFAYTEACRVREQLILTFEPKKWVQTSLRRPLVEKCKVKYWLPWNRLGTHPLCTRYFFFLRAPGYQIAQAGCLKTFHCQLWSCLSVEHMMLGTYLKFYVTDKNINAALAICVKEIRKSSADESICIHLKTWTCCNLQVFLLFFF